MANQTQKIVYKMVLTGGPCGGKTTGQSRLSTFFENLGWKWWYQVCGSHPRGSTKIPGEPFEDHDPN